MATTVYEASISGQLDGTLVTMDVVGLGTARRIARCWINHTIELWNGSSFVLKNFTYRAALIGYEAPLNVIRPAETYTWIRPLDSNILRVDEVGGVSNTFSFSGNIKVEQDGDDVVVTITGTLGSKVYTYPNHIFVRVDPEEVDNGSATDVYGRTWGNAGFWAWGNYSTGNNYYGEVTTVDNPTRRFYGGIYGQDGGAGQPNWSDWDNLITTGHGSGYTVSYNGTGSIVIGAWPPPANDYKTETVRVAEKAADRYAVVLSYNQYVLTVQSTPPTDVSIAYLPTPDDDAEGSPQNTSFNIRYSAEEIAFSPSPDIIGQTTPQQSGVFYWVWYQVKYGGVQPDVEFTAPATDGRRHFVRWDYTGGSQVNVLLDWGTLTRNVVCHTHYNYDIRVVAPAINPPGYAWLYWDFLAGDHRLSKLQDFLLDANRTIIATYEEWVAEDAVAMWVDSKQIPFAAATFNGALYIKRRDESPATWNNAILIDNSSSAGYSNPGIVMTDDGRIIVTALDGDEATVDAAYKTFYSDDMGTIWTGPV